MTQRYFYFIANGCDLLSSYGRAIFKLMQVDAKLSQSQQNLTKESKTGCPLCSIPALVLTISVLHLVVVVVVGGCIEISSQLIYNQSKQ